MPDLRLSPAAATTESLLVLGVWQMLGVDAIQDTHSSAPTAAATTLTVATDATTRDEIGDRIEWPFDGTYERAEITAVAATTLTIRRGVDGTTAAAHAANAVFVKSPHYSSVNIQKAINDAVAQDLYPELYAVYETQLSPGTTWSAETTLLKEIDKVAEWVLYAYQKSDNTPTTLTEVSISEPFYADATLASTHFKVVRLERIPDDNNTIFVQYIRKPAIADLSDGMQRVVEYGAARRVVEQRGASLLQTTDIVQGGVHAPGGSQREARWFLAMQQEAKVAERAILRARFPMRKPRWRPSVRRRHYA